MTFPRLGQRPRTVTGMPADDDPARCPRVPGLALFKVRPPRGSLHVHDPIQTQQRTMRTGHLAGHAACRAGRALWYVFSRCWAPRGRVWSRLWSCRIQKATDMSSAGATGDRVISTLWRRWRMQRRQDHGSPKEKVS
jgi:hypothetical protein